jgi:hypothetical protein
MKKSATGTDSSDHHAARLQASGFRDGLIHDAPSHSNLHFVKI